MIMAGNEKTYVKSQRHKNPWVESQKRLAGLFSEKAQLWQPIHKGTLLHLRDTYLTPDPRAGLGSQIFTF